MAEAVALDSWDGTGVRLGDVAGALAVLRHQSTDGASARTAVMTLIAVAPGDDQAYVATDALRSLGGHHPARILILRPDPDQVAGLDGRATLYGVASDGHQVNFEEVVLGVRGQAARHLDSVVEAFTLSDLPVVVWYVSAVPDPADPLLSVATAVVLDSRDAEGVGQLRGLLELARRRTVVDLSWIRLRPWRELLAGLFDPPERRAWLGSVEQVEVKGKVGPRRLLGGWLATLLELLPRQVVLTDARHVEIRVTCAQGGRRATFEVVRGDLARTVASRAALPEGPVPGHVITLAEAPLLTALSSALTHLGPSVTWERALSAAGTLVR